MRYALAVTGTTLLFGGGFLAAACSGSDRRTTVVTQTGPPYGSQINHSDPAQPLPKRALTTRKTVTTVGYLGTNGQQSTATMTYTTTVPESGGPETVTQTTSITFTQTER